MKKDIYIFIGSSIVEFKSERESVENFIYRLGKEFRKNYGVSVEPILCPEDSPLTIGGSQGNINEMVRKSDYCYFLFFTKAGQYTREEFEVAVEKFSETGKPKLYTYFKELGGETAEESLNEFKEELGKLLGHYYGTFEHIDTVKLRILLNLKLQELDFVEIKIEGNDCLVGGKAVLSVENVAEFVKNGILTERKDELEYVTGKYLALKDKYAAGECSSTESQRYIDLASRRQRLIDEIEQLQKSIFNMSLNMCRDEMKGNMSDRHKEAYRLLVEGKLDEALKMLPPEEMDKEYYSGKSIRKAAREILDETDASKAAGFVREYRTRIDALTIQINNPDRFNEIEEIYEKITAEALEFGVELSTVLDFIVFLHLQNKKKAYEIIEKVEETYLQYADQFDAFTLSNAYYLFGTIYGAVASKRNEAEKYLLKSIEIGEKLVEENPDGFNSVLVDIYNNVAFFYVSHGNPTKAEKYYLKTIRICEHLFQENPGKIKFSLAVCYNNFGDFYCKQRDAQKAEFYFVKAKDIFEELVAEEPERVNYYLAGTYNNIGLIYSGNLSKRKETEENYLKAKDIYEKLAKTNPERFNSSLANIYNNIALFCMECGDTENAGEYHMEAVRIRKKLADENPERFSVDLSQSYCSIAMFYYNQGNNENAKKYFHNAIAIMEKIVGLDPDSFNAHLANIYNLIGSFYFNQRQPAEAKKYLEKAVELREKLAGANPERFNAELAVSYNNIGAFYLSQQEDEEAEKYFGKAIEIYEKLVEKYPEIYNEALAGIYGNTGFFCEKHYPEKAKEYYLKEMYIKEKLVQEDPQRFNPELAICCFRLARLLDNYSYFEKALKLAMTRPDHPQCRQIIDCYERKKKNIIDDAEKEAAVDCIADEKRRREECEAAEECYRKEPNYENRGTLASAYYMLGLLLVIKDKGNVLSEAEVFFNKSLALRKENYNENRCYENRAKLGSLLEWLGDIAIGKKTDEATLVAEDYYVKAFELFKENYCEIQDSESREALKKICNRLLNINKNRNTVTGKIATAKLAKLIEDLSEDE